MSGASPQSSASHLLTFLVSQLQFLRDWKLSDRRLYEVFERGLLSWGNHKGRNSPNYYPFQKHAFFLRPPVQHGGLINLLGGARSRVFLICGKEIICDGVPKGSPMWYFTVTLLRTVNTGRTDGCTCIYYWVVGGVYCGIDGVGNVKFIIWTDNKQRNIRKIFIVN